MREVVQDGTNGLKPNCQAHLCAIALVFTTKNEQNEECKRANQHITCIFTNLNIT